MNKKVIASTVLVSAVLAGCAPPATVAFNGDSVTIRTSTPQEQDKQSAAIEAQRICGKVGDRAEYASTTYIRDLNYEHLFLCI